jgi:hypothetical protein
MASRIRSRRSALIDSCEFEKTSDPTMPHINYLTSSVQPNLLSLEWLNSCSFALNANFTMDYPPSAFITSFDDGLNAHTT